MVEAGNVNNQTNQMLAAARKLGVKQADLKTKSGESVVLDLSGNMSDQQLSEVITKALKDSKGPVISSFSGDVVNPETGEKERVQYDFSFKYEQFGGQPSVVSNEKQHKYGTDQEGVVMGQNEPTARIKNSPKVNAERVEQWGVFSDYFEFRKSGTDQAGMPENYTLANIRLRRNDSGEKLLTFDAAYTEWKSQLKAKNPELYNAWMDHCRALGGGDVLKGEPKAMQQLFSFNLHIAEGDNPSSTRGFYTSGDLSNALVGIPDPSSETADGNTISAPFIRGSDGKYKVDSGSFKSEYYKEQNAGIYKEPIAVRFIRSDRPGGLTDNAYVNAQKPGHGYASLEFEAGNPVFTVPDPSKNPNVKIGSAYMNEYVGKNVMVRRADISFDNTKTGADGLTITLSVASTVGREIVLTGQEAADFLTQNNLLNETMTMAHASVRSAFAEGSTRLMTANEIAAFKNGGDRSTLISNGDGSFHLPGMTRQYFVVKYEVNGKESYYLFHDKKDAEAVGFMDRSPFVACLTQLNGGTQPTVLSQAFDTQILSGSDTRAEVSMLYKEFRKSTNYSVLRGNPEIEYMKNVNFNDAVVSSVVSDSGAQSMDRISTVGYVFTMPNGVSYAHAPIETALERNAGTSKK